jgi:two-component system sensor histidine kinase/response regulator
VKRSLRWLVPAPLLLMLGLPAFMGWTATPVYARVALSASVLLMGLWLWRVHRAQQSLLQSTRAEATRFFSLVQGADDAIVSKALDGTITFWNDAAARMFGHSADEMLGKREDDLIPPERRVEEEHIMSQLLGGIRIRQFESVRVRPDQRVVNISLTASLVRDSAGKVIGSSRIIRDISRRKKMEGMVAARLHLMERGQRSRLADFYQLALDEIEERTASTIAFFHVVNPDQQTLSLQSWSTRTMRTMCATQPEQLHYPIAQAGVWCDCVRRRQPVIHNDYASLPDKRGMPEGHARIVRELVVPIFRGDSIVAVVGVGNKTSDYDASDVEILRQLGDFSWEIIERKQTEEALRQSVSLLQATLESTADGILAVDAGGQTTGFNQRFAQLWGFPDDLLQTRSDQALLDCASDKVADPRAFIARISQINSQPAQDSFDSFSMRDGREVERYSRPQLVDGRPVGRVWSFRDVTLQRRAEAEQEKLFAELTRSNADLEQFAFVASHDLKSPLRAIDSLAGWLEEDLGPSIGEESRKHLRYLRQRAKRMETLLDDLLAYSRAGRISSELGTIQLPALVEEVLALLHVPKSFHVRVVEPGPRFETATTPLRQVMTNLIANAIKHHDKPSGDIELRGREDGSFYEFTVADDGPGIPPEFHERVFGMFQTLKPRDQVEGSGMGLALVKRIVTQFGGTVSIACREPRGSIFRVRWPKEIAA